MRTLLHLVAIQNVGGHSSNSSPMLTLRTGITLWGQSAGGGSVTAYSYAWPEDPKLAGLIADSGALSRASSSDTAQGNFTYLAGLVGCGEKSPEDELACMRTVPARDLENTLSNYIISQASPSLSFRPVVDEKTFFSNYTERTLAGAVAQIPLITGSNTNEGAGFVPFTPDGPGAEVLYNTTQNIIACPVAELAQIRGLGNLTTYRYLYAGNFSNISPLPWFGAYHSAELPMLFGTHYEYRANSTEYQWETANAMQALWVSFAQDPERGPVRISPGAATGEADGNPDGEVVFEWPQWQGGDELLVIAEGDTVFRIGAAEDVGFCRLDQ
jgi:carboxylesterase type B